MTAASTLSIPRLTAWAFVICLLAASGCGGSGTVPVRGKVTYKGAPLTLGTVRFVPADPKIGRLAIGNIGPGGGYAMSTFVNGDGVLPGEYLITVSAVDDSAAKPKEVEKGYEQKNVIPKRYQDPEKSGLREKIERSRTLDIELKEE